MGNKNIANNTSYYMWCILRSENDFIYIFLRKTLTQKNEKEQLKQSNHLHAAPWG